MDQVAESLIKAGILIPERREIRIDNNIDDRIRIHYGLIWLGRQSSYPITIAINSDGGFLHSEKRFIVAIKGVINLHVPVIGIVQSRALSAAFGILQACTVRAAHQGTHLMFHAPRIPADRAAELGFPAFDDIVSYDDPWYRSELNMYANRSGQPLEKIKSWGMAEYVFSAEEAFKLGFLDELLPPYGVR